MTLIESARQAWEAGASIRANRRRLKNYTYGRQWEDLPNNPDGERPLTNNLLRSLVKAVVGRFRNDLTAARNDRSAADPMERLRRLNRLDELDARALEEFLISGCAVQKVAYERRFEGEDVWIDNVNPDRFFVNRFMDPRGHDIRMAGMLHDMGLGEMKLRFGHGNRHRIQEITQIFSRAVALGGGRHMSLIGLDDEGETEFGRSADPSLCRVVELWTLESNHGGEPSWQCVYLTADGTVIDRTASPFPHGSHPFAVKFYPLTDGEVHPFIEDVIDQQRHINKLINITDQILTYGAKGALLFPSDALMPGVSYEETVRLWNRPGAVIPYDSRCSQLPTEVISAGQSLGATSLLNVELQMFRQISGVTSALQGEPAGGNVSASMYESQVQNSAIALMDIYETFNDFRHVRDSKALRTKN